MLSKLLQRLSSYQLFQNFSWLALGELFHRVLRLGTVVIVARILTPEEYGLIAIIFLAVEFANVFTLQGGITGKLVQADEQHLARLCQTAYGLNWLICISIFLLQCVASLPISWFYEDSRLILPICTTALVYLVIPNFAIQAALIQRENRMKVIALAGACNSALSNVMTVAFVLSGFGLWSVVLSHVLSHVSWLAIYLKHHSWRPKQKFTLLDSPEIIRFARAPLGMELLEKLRANLDYILVGRFLGLEALGVYYFAFNAGIGISLNVIKMFSVTLLPYFCEVRQEQSKLRKKYFESLRTIALVTIPLIVLQSSLAPFYVPIVFGEKWISAIPLLIIVCLSAIPRPFGLAAEQLLLSLDRGNIALLWNVLFTSLFSLFLLAVVQVNLMTVAWYVLFAHAIALPAFTLWTTLNVFRPDKPAIKGGTV